MKSFSVAKTLGVLFVSGLSSAAFAQAPAPGDVCPIPYTIGNAVKGAEVAAKFEAGALKKLGKVPDISGKAGGEILKTAYAGVSSQALSEVFAAYGCRVKNHLQAGDAADKDKKIAGITEALADLDLEIAKIQAAQATGTVSAVATEYQNASTRAADAPVLARPITEAALADVDPTKLFLATSTKQFWVGTTVSSVLNISACGGVVKAAISDGGSSLQVTLSRAKAILINYLDPATKPKVSLANLLVALPVPPVNAASVPPASFKGCTDTVAAKQKVEVPTAPSTDQPAPSTPQAEPSSTTSPPQ